MKLFIYLVFLLAISCHLVYAQTRQKEIVEIPVDISKAKSILLHPANKEIKHRFILDSEAALSIKRTNHFLNWNNCYILISPEGAWIFSSDGSCKQQLMKNPLIEENISRITRGWLKGDSLCLYSQNDCKVLTYHLGAGTVKTRTVPSSRGFNELIPLEHGGYIARLTYTGVPEERADLGLFNESFQEVKEIGRLKLSSGLTIGGSNFFQYKDTVLYWRPLENKIYGIDTSVDVLLRYHILFSGKGIRPSLPEDQYTAIQAMNTSPELYASLLGNVYESEQLLAFSFLHDAKRYLCRYSKVSKEVSVITLTCFGQNTLVAGVLFVTDNAVLVLEQNESGIQGYEIAF